MSGGHAHYVIIDRAGHRVWSRDRGARTLQTDVLAGPERTIAFVRAQDGGSPDFWMNSVWWRAVLLLDLRHRRMRVQIVDDVCAPSVPEIRAWLRTVRGVWPGWDVRWAPRGLHEVMDYLGLPYDTVRYLDDPPPSLAGQWASPPNGDDPTEIPETLIAVRDGQGRLSLSSTWILTPDAALLAGPEALLVPQEQATDMAVLEGVPWNGLHVDAAARRADWWATDLPLDLRRLPALWPGWTLTDHGDAYEEVTALIGPALLITPPSPGRR